MLREVRERFLEAIASRAPHVVQEFLELKPLAVACHAAQGYDPDDYLITLLPVWYWNPPPWEDERHPRHFTGIQLEEWRVVEAFRDALLAWAERYSLVAPWILDMGSTNLAYLDKPWDLPKGGGVRPDEGLQPVETVTITLPALPHTVKAREWRAAARKQAEDALDRHIEHRKAHFEAAGTPVVRLTKQRRARVETAAAWQVSTLTWSDFIVAEGEDVVELQHTSLRDLLLSILSEVGVQARPIPT